MNIFVINSGSSSIKYQLITMPARTVVCSGIVERIGMLNSTIVHKIFMEGKPGLITAEMEILDHAAGLQEVARLLSHPVNGVVSDPSDINVVGHRVVHGGESFAATTVINSLVKEEIKKLFSLAPLHNPPNYLGIEVAEKIFTTATQVAVFDTAFHQTLPPKAYRFAIPADFYRTYGIRAYGFHGTSHKYVSAEAGRYLGNAGAKLITIHLGNGCSITAVENGKSIDTSMGMGPMNGLVMGTRSGDIDQSVIFHLVNQLGYDLDQVNSMLNKKSGMLGLTGFSDMRDIRREIEQGNEAAALAFEMYAYRIRKYIGAYTAILNGVDAIVFTGGVGENDVALRKMVASNLTFLGIHLNEEKNNQRIDGIREINTDNAAVKILIVPTNEELEIARQCYQLLSTTG